jgi:putative PIN family toxin of toxin-antitoxin system
MKDRERVVVDTNTLVSRLLLSQSVPGRAVRRVVDEAQILVSEETTSELADVLARAKVDRYVTIEDRQQFLLLLDESRMGSRVGAFIRTLTTIKFLASACGEAATLITGDDRWFWNPFQGISIVTPADIRRTRGGRRRVRPSDPSRRVRRHVVRGENVLIST